MQESRLKWYGHVLRRICGQEIECDGGAGGKQGEEDLCGGGWIPPGTTCLRENCQARKGKTEFNGGAYVLGNIDIA